MSWLIVNPVIKYSVRELCLTPYYNHPKGCPNFNKRASCPPQAKYFDEVYDLTRPIYAIYNIFDLAEHVSMMRTKHPNWSEYQLKCCLYWQGKARKELSEKIAEFLKIHKELGICRIPEAMGVDLTATMQDVGIKLEYPPQKIAYQIALAANPKKSPLRHEGVD